jgi:hypothetical protein
MKKIHLLVLFFYFLISETCGQQDLQAQFNIANSLFNQEKFFDAITEAKRLIFFDTSKVFYFRANLLIAKSYKAGDKFSEALRYFSLAETQAVSDSSIFDIQIEIIKIQMLRRSTTSALNNLERLEKDKRFIKYTNQVLYWRGWCYIFKDEWNLASQEFAKIDSTHELKKFCEDVHNRKYSVTFAKVISYFLPGAGQIYTGNYISGLMSFGWNVLWAYLSINSLLENRIFDGLMTTNFLWFRFYSGNLYNAEEFAKQKNLEITNNALLELQNNNLGPKP